MPVIPFYGAERPDLFAVERAAMDRPGALIAELDRRLPRRGVVADIGAGDGFTGVRLQTPERTIVAVEPAAEMIRPDRPLRWVRGDAARLPFGADTLDAAYATWAYFFSRGWDPGAGIEELHRTVRAGGPLLIADNLGGDEFCALASHDITGDLGFWAARGFDCVPIDTAFEFDDLAQARALLEFYFGSAGRAGARLRLTYRIGVFAGESRGPAT